MPEPTGAGYDEVASGETASEMYAITDTEASIVRRLPELLRGRACPAGLPHTGDDPSADHGHTNCWFMHLAATEIERLRQGLWDIYAAAGADTDGDPTPAAVCGDLVYLVRGAVAELHDDYLEVLRGE